MSDPDLVQVLRNISALIDDDTVRELVDARLNQAADRIEALEAVHTDPYTPCPKCGFSIRVIPQQPFVYREDDE